MKLGKVFQSEVLATEQSSLVTVGFGSSKIDFYSHYDKPASS